MVLPFTDQLTEQQQTTQGSKNCRHSNTLSFVSHAFNSRPFVIHHLGPLYTCQHKQSVTVVDLSKLTYSNVIRVENHAAVENLTLKMMTQ